MPSSMYSERKAMKMYSPWLAMNYQNTGREQKVCRYETILRKVITSKHI